MNLPAFLVAQTIPIAGIVFAGSKDSELRDILTIAYIAILGLMFSVIIATDGWGLGFGWLSGRAGGQPR